MLMEWWGRLPKVELFLQVETRQNASVFLCRFGAAHLHTNQTGVGVRERSSP
jgi:hypothetical protein